MNCPKCGFEQALEGPECQKCGLIFYKYIKTLEKKTKSTVYNTVAAPKINDHREFIKHLPFHEAGHLIFRPFGRLMASLGGSLGQLLMPLVCLVVF